MLLGEKNCFCPFVLRFIGYSAHVLTGHSSLLCLLELWHFTSWWFVLFAEQICLYREETIVIFLITKCRKQKRYVIQRIAVDKLELNIMIPITCWIKWHVLLVANVMLQIQFCSRVTKGVPLLGSPCVVLRVVYAVWWTVSGLHGVFPVTFVHKIQESSRSTEGRWTMWWMLR